MKLIDIIGLAYLLSPLVAFVTIIQCQNDVEELTERVTESEERLEEEEEDEH